MKSTLSLFIFGATLLGLSHSGDAVAQSRSITMSPVKIAATKVECADPSPFSMEFTMTKNRVQLKDKRAARRKDRASMTFNKLGEDGIGRQFVVRFSKKKVSVNEVGVQLKGPGSCAFNFEGRI